MSTATVASLVDSLQELEVLEPEQWQALAAMKPRPTDTRELARILLKKGWLSRYQATKILRGEGDQLIKGPYLVLDQLGEGGMGQVYKARHRKLGHIVALKVIHRDRVRDPKARKRFERETQAVAQLHHPNIVEAYDAGELNQGFYLAMEYVPGTDLAKLLREKGRLPIHVACSYVRQAALGLQHAHERGLIHRDIKPSNLLLSLVNGHASLTGQGPMTNDKGLIKILDLGLARVERTEAGDELSQVTCENLVIGTPDYIAPEQALRPHDVDSRADIYSLGCTFYHLLTGRIPFPANAVMEKLLKHKFETAEPVATLRPEISAALSSLVNQMLSKQPEGRPASAAVVAAALEPFCSEVQTVVAAEPATPTALPTPGDVATAEVHAVLPVSSQESSLTLPLDSPFGDTPVAFREAARRPHRQWSRWALMGGISCGLTFTLLILLLAIANSRSNFPGAERADARAPASGTTPAFQSISFTVVANRPWQDTHVDVSLSARPMTIRARGRWQRGSSASPLTAAGDARAPWHEAVSPNAPVMSLIARVGTSEAIIPMGTTTAFTPQESGRLFVQANDLDLSDNTGTLTLEIDGGTLNPSEARPPPLLPSQVLEREWQTLATRVNGTQAPLDRWRELHAFRLKHAGTQQAARAVQAMMQVPSVLDQRPVFQELKQDNGEALAIVAALGERFTILRKPRQCLAFSADGSQLAMTADRFEIEVWNLENLRVTTTLKGHSDAIAEVAFTPDGRRLISAASGLGDRSVRAWDLTESNELYKLGGQWPNWCTTAALSPDGRSLLTGMQSHAILWNTETADSVRLLSAKELGSVTAVAFTPDGRRALLATDDKKLRVWDVDKGNVLREIEGHEGGITSLAVMPDGRSVYSASDDKTVRRWDLESGKEVLRLDLAQRVASLSLAPDGEALVVLEPEGALTLWSTATGSLMRTFRIPSAASIVVFAPDGRHLAVAGRQGKHFIIRLPR
jgi:serine/threonine-protein kinase